ncbi:MAG TPA: hypothetical protein VLE73_02320 [Candidatus Saccharimonadales bacterium]|nr:hypothetical protein [Candidatus Saccharimonadales bacterium]
MTNTNDSFVGKWRCQYTYPSLAHNGHDSGEFELQAYKRGSQLLFESVPNDEGSSLLVRMSVDGRVASGNWEEHTSPTGSYNGTMFTGTFQLQVDAANQRMAGKWAGVQHDKDLKQASVHTGTVSLDKID